MATETDLEIIDDVQLPEGEELNRLVDYVFAHRKDAIKGFMRDEELQISGNKSVLRDRIDEALADGTIDAGGLIGLLDTIEGWGNQHIYMFKAPDGEKRVWQSEARAKKRLQKIDAEELFNHRRPLVLPDEPTLSSVEWSTDRVRFIWVEKREWNFRRDDLDCEEDGVLYKAYEDKVARGITSFDWNLNTGHAALMIQRLPTGERYDQIRQEYEEAIEDAVHISNFTRVKITTAIKKLENSDEVNNRQVAHETGQGSRAQFTSKSRKADAFDDPDLKKARDALGQTSSVLGNFYWQPNDGNLDRQIHTKLYASDQRVGVFGECTEEEVQYVLSRIRHFGR